MSSTKNLEAHDPFSVYCYSTLSFLSASCAYSIIIQKGLPKIAQSLAPQFLTGQGVVYFPHNVSEWQTMMTRTAWVGKSPFKWIHTERVWSQLVGYRGKIIMLSHWLRKGKGNHGDRRGSLSTASLDWLAQSLTSSRWRRRRKLPFFLHQKQFHNFSCKF